MDQIIADQNYRYKDVLDYDAFLRKPFINKELAVQGLMVKRLDAGFNFRGEFRVRDIVRWGDTEMFTDPDATKDDLKIYVVPEATDRSEEPHIRDAICKVCFKVTVIVDRRTASDDYAFLKKEQDAEKVRRIILEGEFMGLPRDMVFPPYKTGYEDSRVRSIFNERRLTNTFRQSNERGRTVLALCFEFDMLIEDRWKLGESGLEDLNTLNVDLETRHEQRSSSVFNYDNP